MSIKIIDEVEITESKENFDFVQPDEEIVKQIEEKLNYNYQQKELECLSSKLTASSLDSTENSFEYLTSSKPAFMNKKGLTPAQRGTAMHTFMQFCDYENSKNNLEAEIERLLSMGFVSKEQADVLDRTKLADFFNSDFALRMFKSEKIYREIKLSSFVDTVDIYGIESDESVLVQGIADCVFEENGELVLVDYKTDRVSSAEELLERYKKQIMFYKSAVSKALNKPVKDAVLYSFYLDKVCYYK
jgi:ATP-dependent helicase/nuclease subunit A